MFGVREQHERASTIAVAESVNNIHGLGRWDTPGEPVAVGATRHSRLRGPFSLSGAVGTAAHKDFPKQHSRHVAVRGILGRHSSAVKPAVWRAMAMTPWYAQDFSRCRLLFQCLAKARPSKAGPGSTPHCQIPLPNPVAKSRCQIPLMG